MLSPRRGRSSCRAVLHRRHILPETARPRVILLQGPVGPFFKHLQRYLDAHGYDAWRITFNPGDRLFAGRGKTIAYRGGLSAWSAWLRAFLVASRADLVILFGSDRPLHSAARVEAGGLGLGVLSLEEGYIRGGYVTVEKDANNWLSPIAGKLPGGGASQVAAVRREAVSSGGFSAMCAYGGAYYGVRTLLSRPLEREVFHRRVRPLAAVAGWPRNLWRRLAHTAAHWSLAEYLLEHHDRRYFLVPLQVSADSQMRDAALGWTNERLIRETLASFARAAPPTHRLVYKVHPLERGESSASDLVRALAGPLGIAGRVDVMDAGSLGLMTRHAAGVITINSTSGLSAIHHGVPLLVVGRALYENDALATCARGAPDFDAFWRGGHVADAELRRRYLAWVTESCLKPGDFYAAEAARVTCAGVLEALRSLQREKASRAEAAMSAAAC